MSRGRARLYGDLYGHCDHNPGIQHYSAKPISHDRRDLNARSFRMKTVLLASLVATVSLSIASYVMASPVEVTDRLLATSGRPIIADSSNGAGQSFQMGSLETSALQTFHHYALTRELFLLRHH